MKLSLITATHHRLHHLRQKALPSVLAQSVERSELEWIVVNDGSDPETAQLITQLHPHFAVTHLPMPHPEQGFGLCHARNLGLEHASGEIVAYLDDDNAIAPDFTRQVLHGFEQRPDINFSMVQQRRRRDTSQKQGQPFVAPRADCTASSLLRHDDLFDSNGFAHRRQNAPRWNPGFRIFCDYEYFLQCLQQWGEEAFMLHLAVLVDYVQTTDGIIGQSHYGEWAQELYRICETAQLRPVVQPCTTHLRSVADRWQAKAQLPIKAFAAA